jgi:hypothetical protein
LASGEAAPFSGVLTTPETTAAVTAKLGQLTAQLQTERQHHVDQIAIERQLCGEQAKALRVGIENMEDNYRAAVKAKEEGIEAEKNAAFHGNMMWAIGAGTAGFAVGILTTTVTIIYLVSTTP